MKQNSIAVLLLVAVITATGGFFAGMKYQQSKRNGAFLQMMNGQGRNNMVFRDGSGSGNARNGLRPVTGEIIKATETSITVRLNDGSSKIILVTDSTVVNKAEQGTPADLVQGAAVAVFGSENTDGSVTAQNIQLNPTRIGNTTVPTP